MSQQANPHAILDFKRFTADMAAGFVLWQQDLLKKHISSNQWITTNLMADYSAVDPLRFKKMDLVTYTKYLVAGFDTGHGFWIALNYSSSNHEINIPVDAKIIIGEKELKPAGVVVWK